MRNRAEYSNQEWMDWWTDKPDEVDDAIYGDAGVDAGGVEYPYTRTIDKSPGMGKVIYFPDNGAYQFDTRVPEKPQQMNREEIDAMLATKYAKKGEAPAVPKRPTDEELPALVFDTRKGKTDVRRDVAKTSKEAKHRFITKKRVLAGMGASALLVGAWLGPRDVVCYKSDNIPALQKIMEWTGHTENLARCENPAPMFYQPDAGPVIIEGEN